MYAIRKRKRGKCLIFSNKSFTGPLEIDCNGINRIALDTRLGAEKDEDRLEQLFTQLHFDVVIHRNQKKSVSIIPTLFSVFTLLLVSVLKSICFVACNPALLFRVFRTHPVLWSVHIFHKCNFS